METSATKSRLLLVDSDPKSLRVLDVSLKNAGFEVVAVTNALDGLKALDVQIPDLVISSTDLDGMDGFEFCGRMKASAVWSKIPFIFVSNRKSIEDKIRGLELGADDFLTKPIYIREIGIRVRTALQRIEREGLESRREGRTRFSGDLSDVSVVDLIQTVELNRKSGIVHIVTPDGRRGMIYFRDGKVVDAEVGKLSGSMAVYRLFAWLEGNFAVDFKPVRRRDVIDLPVAGLLIEGMRRLDERARLLENLPSLRSIIDVDFRVLAEQLADLPDEMNRILRVCDGTRTLQEVVEDSDCPDLEALTTLHRLYQTKIIFARDVRERGSNLETIANLAKWLSENSNDRSTEIDDLPVSLGDPSDFVGAKARRKGSQEPNTMPALDPACGIAEEQRMTHLGYAPVSPELDITKPLMVSFPSTVDATNAPSFGEALVAEAAVDPSTAVFRLSPTTPAPLSGVETNPIDLDPAKADGKKPVTLGLAERLLSEDSEIRATALLPSDDSVSAIVDRPAPKERGTQPYGQLPLTGVSQQNSQVVGQKAAALPTSPLREVDWGPWKIVSSAEIPVPGHLDSTASDKAQAARQEDLPAKQPTADLQSPKLSLDPSHDPDEKGAQSPASKEKKAVSSNPPGVLTANQISARRLPKATPNRRKWIYLLLIFAAIGIGFYWMMRTTRTTLPKAPVLKDSMQALPVLPKQPLLRESKPDKNKIKVAASPEEDAAKQAQYTHCLKTDANGKGRPAEVAIACRKALQANPLAVDVMLLLSRAELDRGKLDEARNLARKAVVTKPDFADGYVYLGGAEQELGRIGEARAAYKKYLELAPTGEHARELRAILNNL